MSKPYRFFNSGVLYIDVAKWNNENIGHRALGYIRQNPDLCTLPDEHALNAILDGNIAQLSPVWNMRPPPRWRRGKLNIVQPVIIHYTGDDKPWRRFVYNKGLFPDLSAYHLYEDFLRDSPWPGWLSEQWTRRDFYLNMRWEIGRILRKLGLRGGLDEPSTAQITEHVDAVRKYLREERFMDIEQGIVICEKGKFRLKEMIAP
jgi:lipopolysaccharide biosynthesis glycosyltransferase